MEWRLSRRRFAIFCVDVFLVILALGWIGIINLPYVSPVGNGPSRQTLLIYYPASAAGGVFNGNTSKASYVQVTVYVAANQTIVENTPVIVTGAGCVTAPSAKGLYQVVVQFPQAKPTNPLSPTGGNLILTNSSQGSYCRPYYGGMKFLAGGPLTIEWPNAYNSFPTMYVQYSNGTEHSSTSTDSVLVQSGGTLSANEAAVDAFKVGLPALGIILIEAANRTIRPKKEPSVFLETFPERLQFKGFETQWSIRLTASRRIEHCQVFWSGQQLPTFPSESEARTDVLMGKGESLNFRIPIGNGMVDDATVNVQDGRKVILSVKWGTIPRTHA